jgi:hypothetical protein
MPGSGHAAAVAYCRDARRLRGTLAHQPARMHRKLRELASRQEPATRAPQARYVSPAGLSGRSVAPRARAFADEVARALDGPVLRYSARRALLRSAYRFGIGDFEANLVIAAVQHERRSAVAQKPPAAAPQPARPRFLLAPLLLVLAVESLVAAGVWQVCFAG